MNKLKTFALSVLLCYVSTGWNQHSYAVENVSVWEFSYYGYNVSAGMDSYYADKDSCELSKQNVSKLSNYIKVSDCYQVNKFM